jgi:hypothetical protein
VWVSVTEFKEPAFGSFEKKFLRFFVACLLFIKHSQFVLGLEAGGVGLAQLLLSAFKGLAEQRFCFLIAFLIPAEDAEIIDVFEYIRMIFA